jgi:hypothetical protein
MRHAVLRSGASCTDCISSPIPSLPRRRIREGSARPFPHSYVKQHLAAIHMLFDWLVPATPSTSSNAALAAIPQAPALIFCRLSNCHFCGIGFSHAQMLLNNWNCLGNRFLQLIILRGGLRLLKSRKIVRVILYHQVDVFFIKALSG